MSLIIHMKIPGAIIAASDCRITGTEPSYSTVKHQEDDGIEKFYDYVKTDSEQKTFLFTNANNKSFAISYCGNANLKGYPASYQIKGLLNKITEVSTTRDIADKFIGFWKEQKIDNPPSLLISGYNDRQQSILELTSEEKINEHFSDKDSFGIIYHGQQKIANALVTLGKYEYSLFRLQDSIDFCDLLITTTARVMAHQKVQQTVSYNYDLLVITENKAKWVRRSSFEI